MLCTKLLGGFRLAFLLVVRHRFFVTAFVLLVQRLLNVLALLVEFVHSYFVPIVFLDVAPFLLFLSVSTFW